MVAPTTAARDGLITGPTLSRRAFVKAGGALFVSFYVPAPLTTTADAQSRSTSLDPTKLVSWLEIHADNRIIARTGRAEIGTGMSAYYAQVIAEELNVRPESITLILANTDETPDGGFAASLLVGAANLRKVSAYTYQALLGLASQQLGIPVSSLTVADGMVTGPADSSKSVSFGQLVQGQQLDLKIPITGRMPELSSQDAKGIAWRSGLVVGGEPPTKPISQYKVVGTSYPMPGVPDIVTGKTKWVGDVRLPGMLYARMIRPATLGSTLTSAGALDKKRFPTAQVVTKGNLVAVLSPNEWEAVSAARAVAGTTRWTAWEGLPGSENLTRAIRAYPWREPSSKKGTSPDVDAAMARASKTLAVSYEQAYIRHAPVGPFAAVADVRREGTTVWSHSSNVQAMRVHLAKVLDASVDSVVLRWLPGPGQYGRTTSGGDGPEADAVILSKLVGQPVSVQWTLQDDMVWSSVSPGWVADVKAGLDADGKVIAIRSDWYSPDQNDARMVGAILAGIPTVTPTQQTPVSTILPYNKLPILEQAYGMPGLGVDSPSTVGLRGLILRTPWQRNQNFAMESLLNEVAAATGVDPIQLRTSLTGDQRLLEIMKTTAAAAGWQSRPSPNPQAARGGSAPLKGRGMATIIRYGGYWTGIAEVEVTPDTGRVRVTRFTVGAELGKVINPRHLKSIIEGGVIMGLGEALKEQVTFDKATVTSNDFRRYRICTMDDIPDIKVVQVSRDDHGFGMGGESPNALVPPAVAAAVFDATGVQPRKLPMTPEYIKALLAGTKS